MCRTRLELDRHFALQWTLRDAFAEVSRFRSELYACLTARGDALFELCDALLCTDGPVPTLVDLALAPEHRRGHGALYGGLNQGRIDVARLHRALVGVPLPRTADGRLVLAVDVSPWLRPDANTCADRAFCHTFGRGEGKHQMVPGWPYSVVAALETGRPSWTAVLDAVRLKPGADVAAVTTVQIREVAGAGVRRGAVGEAPSLLTWKLRGSGGQGIPRLVARRPRSVPGPRRARGRAASVIAPRRPSPVRPAAPDG
ncbi:transposase [Streptomyces canus]